MFRLKGCGKCRGDLFLEGTDWHCLQCGRYYYGSLPWSLFLVQRGFQGEDAGAVGRRKRFEKNRLENESAGGVMGV
jgi:hypothetical protein